MPSALLLSIGLTPQLAQAQPGDQNPFREGPCVSAPDQEPEEDGEDGKDADKEKSDGDKAEGGGKGKGGSPDDGKPGEGSKDPGAKPTPEPTPDKPNTPGEPEPEPSESRHPLDPLGIGEKLRELFNPDKDKGSDKGSDEGNAEDDASDPDPSGEPSEGGEKSGDSAKEKAAKEKAAKEKAAKEKAAKEKAEEEAAKEAESEPDADGKKPFPCPEFDKEAYDGADSEQTPVQVPDEPFKLNTTRLGLDGLKYHGIVKVRTHGGTEKRVLKFTAKKVDIKDLHQIVVGPGGKSQHIRSTEGSTSTFRDGTVTMYTEELKGKLFGLIPVTFGPESPPPLDIPTAVFTDAEVIQAGQFGGTLTVPGLKMSLED